MFNCFLILLKRHFSVVMLVLALCIIVKMLFGVQNRTVLSCYFEFHSTGRFQAATPSFIAQDGSKLLLRVS